MKIAVISDTHGFLHPDLADQLDEVDAIVHAGDVGRKEILAALARFAPVHAVRGNVDVEPPLARLPERLAVRFAGRLILLVHIGPFDRHHATWLRRETGRDRPDAFICGHSHIPHQEQLDTMLHFNPGSAGHPRFGRPPSFGMLVVTPARLDAHIVPLRPL